MKFRLRLTLIDAGLPAPQTQIPVVANFRTIAFLDLGWEGYKVAGPSAANMCGIGGGRKRLKSAEIG